MFSANLVYPSSAIRLFKNEYAKMNGHKMRYYCITTHQHFQRIKEADRSPNLADGSFRRLSKSMELFRSFSFLVPPRRSSKLGTD